MRAINKLICTIFICVLLFSASALAASVTDCTISDTNIYASSNLMNIAPSGQYDSTSSVSGITNVANRYLYASSLDSTVYGLLAQYEINNRQGATILVNDNAYGTVLGMNWNYGNGVTTVTDTMSYKYPAAGTYTTTLTLSNELTSSNIVLTDSISLATSGVNDCTVSNVNIYASNNVVNIAPASYDDGGNTANGIITTSNEPLYTTGIDVSGGVVTLQNLRGSTITNATNGLGTKLLFNIIDSASGQQYSDAIYPGTIPTSDEAMFLTVTYGNYLKTYVDDVTVNLNTFVPNQSAWAINSEPLEIEKTTTNTYNPTNQFTLDRAIVDSKFISKSEAIIIYGNAVYKVSSDANTVSPVNATNNGNTVSLGYIGLNNAVVVDVDGRIIFYDYASGKTMGVDISGYTITDIVCNNDYIIASTQNAGLLVFDASNGGLLSVTTVTNNYMDISNVNNFLLFSDGSALKSLTNLNAQSHGLVITDLVTYDEAITSVNHVRNTNNFIITTTSATYVVSMSSDGLTYTQISASTDGVGLEEVSFNTLLNYVGYDEDTVYWYSYEGISQGNATLIADVNTISMAYQNGLWVAYGGNAMTLYVANQDSNGVWNIIQPIVLDNTVQDVALSDSGYYMVSATANTLYLFSRATPLDVDDTILTTKYYLEVTTYVNGIITSGQTFSVSAQNVGSTSYTSDSSGTYTIEVYPTYTYEITYGGETIIYVANNYALQYLNLDTGVEYYLDGVTYSTNFQDNAIINMYYQDTNNHDNLVRYYIVDTDNVLLYDSGTQQTNNFFAQYSLNTDDYVKVVLTITRYDGGAVTISDGNVFTSMWNYIKRNLVGDDGLTVVLPGATKPLFPLELPMIDGAEKTSDIKQIFFCGILMVIAGLFGVNHSARGTLILALVTLVFTFFKFIYIDWMWVMTMVVIGVLTVFSYSQNN